MNSEGGTAMTAATPQVAAPAPGWGARRVLLLVFGSIVSLLAAAILAAGGVVAWADWTQRDDAGFFSTSTHTFASSGYAISHSDGADLSDAPGWLGNLATVRVRAGGAKPVFIGIASTARLRAYLNGVNHDDIDNLDYDPFSVRYLHRDGTAPSAPPTAKPIWVKSISGSGAQTLTWKLRKGDWSLAVMNADGSRDVRAQISFGADVHYLGWVTLGLIVGGMLVLAGGATMIYFGGRKPAVTR
jgi:hypothetical protein